MKILKLFLLAIVFFSCSDTLDVDVESHYEEAMQLYRSENYDDALIHLDVVFRNIDNDGTDVELKALYLRGFINYLKDDNKAAYTDYLEAIEIGKLIGDKLRVSRLYNEVGQIFYESELYNLALDNFQNALALSQFATSRDRAHYYYGVGKTLNELDRVDEGMKNILSAIDLYADLKDFDGVSSGYNILANAQSRAGNYDLAIDLFQEAVDAVSVLEDKESSLKMLYNNIGNNYLRKGDLEQAENYLLESLKFKAVDSRLWVTYNNLGKVYNEKKEYEKAWSCFKKSLVYNSKKGEMNELAITNEALKKTLENLNQPDSLLHYSMLINDMALPMIQNQSWLKDEEEKIALLTKYQDHEREKAEQEQYAKTSWLMAFIMTFVFMSGVLSVRLWKIYHYKSAEKGLALIKNSNEMVYLLDMFRKEKDEIKKSMDQKIRN